jgi:hypothetical protein
MMPLSIMLLAFACLVGVVILVGFIVGVVVVMRSGQRDTVSSAREDWLHRRSDKDQREW